MFCGYVELIPPNAALPCEATRTLESAFDYLKSTDILVYYRVSMLKLSSSPVRILGERYWYGIWLTHLLNILTVRFPESTAA